MSWKNVYGNEHSSKEDRVPLPVPVIIIIGHRYKSWIEMIQIRGISLIMYRVDFGFWNWKNQTFGEF